MTDNHDWTEEYGPSWVDRLIAADPSILDEIDDWWQSTPHVPMVGSRHHTVPRFYLERFAAAGQLWVRERVTGIGRPERISRAGTIRDFYTFINLDGEKDGRLERILADVEGGAKEVFDRLLNPFQRPAPLDENESMRVALFIAFQLLRTPRHRREEAEPQPPTQRGHPSRLPDPAGRRPGYRVGLPLTPRTLLVIGPRHETGPLQRTLFGAEAVALAEDVNGRLIAQAYDWVAANPAHPTFRTLPFPAPGPIVHVCDGGTAMSRDLAGPPSPRRPSLLGRDRPATTA